MNIVEEANKIYLSKFGKEVYFERAIFFSWYCALGDCKFCYMSSNSKVAQDAKRSHASIIAEILLAKEYNWPISFLSGGIDAKSTDEFLDLLKRVYQIIGKVWLNIGPVSKEQLEKLLPYTEGLIGSIETVNPKLHDFVCPSKPIAPYIQMWKDSNLKRGMTLILGLGETKEDYPLLKNFIQENKIEQIHIYGLNPHKDTYFEKHEAPSQEYKAYWIAKTRIDFPEIKILAGIWRNKVENISILFEAGANAVTKFPIIKEFGSKKAIQILNEVQMADRVLASNIHEFKHINWDDKLKKYNFDEIFLTQVIEKIKSYEKNMTSNL